MHPILFHFGRIAIPTYGVFTAIALLTGLALLVGQAQRLSLRSDKVWHLGLIAILATLFGGRLLLIVSHLHAFRAHPFWVLGLASISGAWIALGAVMIGVAAALLYALAEGLPLLRTADALAPGLALAFALNRIGAFLGGLAWGTRTTLPWGVIYRSFVAYLWYRVPLGVKLHPVQLYDAAASLAILAVLAILPRRRDGEAAGAWLFLYGVARFFLEFLRGDARRFLGGALTLAQVLSIVAVVLGGALWMSRPSSTVPAEAAPTGPS